jgi:hypothetical protein
MQRNTCPGCRAENLATAIICVTCGQSMRPPPAPTGSSTVTVAEEWIPPMPVRAIAPRNTRMLRAGTRTRPDVDAEPTGPSPLRRAIPPRPDVREAPRHPD